jgi:hypothetical protein
MDHVETCILGSSAPYLYLRSKDSQFSYHFWSFFSLQKVSCIFHEVGSSISLAESCSHSCQRRHLRIFYSTGRGTTIERCSLSTLLLETWHKRPVCLVGRKLDWTSLRKHLVCDLEGPALSRRPLLSVRVSSLN